MAKKKTYKTVSDEKEKDSVDLQNLWEERINKAKKKREEEWEKVFRVKLARDYFAGKQNPGYPDDEWITINKIYSHLMAELPSLYSVDPYFYIKTKRSFSPDPKDIAVFEEKAKIRQSYLNYLKGELEMKTKCRLGIQDAQFAFGVVKTHYYVEEKENPDADNEMESEYGKKLKDEDGNPLREPKTVPIKERYCLTRVHPDDFLWSAESSTLEDKWPWIAERIRMTKDEAKEDKRLNQKILDSIQPGEVKKDSFSTDDNKVKEDEPYIFWEIYDLKKKQWLILAENADGLLKEPDSLPKGTECHPYSVLRFTLQDNTPYPIPPVSQMIDPQKEYCLARSRFMTHRKRFNRKYEAFVSGLVDETELEKLESGEDGTIIRKQTQGPVITPVIDAPLDQTGWQEIMALNNDIIEASGYSGESRGLATADSATQADILEKRLNIREGDRLGLVTEWILDIARKLDQLVQANISKDEAIRITGPEGEFWKMVRSQDYEEIEGEFEYSINIGATSPQLPQLERAQFIALLQLFANFPQLLLNRTLTKRVMAMHNFDDEVAIEELRKMAEQMMQGSLPMPGQSGSQPGSPGQPGAGTTGAALGALGGLFNGGGSIARDGGQNA
ncbi:MAG: hypothetical protein PHE50_00275 [Dehalococcoidales bacterium]|nr:hypothetical protein [Dehalococcoidales bacterium]